MAKQTKHNYKRKKTKQNKKQSKQRSINNTQSLQYIHTGATQQIVGLVHYYS